MNLEIASISRTGDREHNEDACDVTRRDAGAVAVVCDGLGGHDYGEWASDAFTRAMMACSNTLLAGDYTSRERAKPVFDATFDEGVRALREVVQAKSAGADSRTTAVVAVLRSDVLATAHIGDSRAYRLNPSGVSWRTRDHSLVQMLQDQGEISEQEMGTHPDQGKLFKSISLDRQDKPSVQVLPPLTRNEALLLCSDGFWEHLTEHELASLVHAPNLQQKLESLAQTAEGRAAGKSDNVTAICARLAAGGMLNKVKQWLS